MDGSSEQERSRSKAEAEIELFLRQRIAAGRLLPAFTNDLPTDSRKNVVAYTQFETRWAVSVLSSAAQPNDKLARLVADLPEWKNDRNAKPTETGMDVLYAFYADLIERGYLAADRPGWAAAIEAFHALPEPNESHDRSR